MEIPLKGDLRHGVCKQWNEKGKLLGKYRMNMGTGVCKQWYPNGQLQYEITTIRGIPNGRQRLWDTAGNLVSECFLLKGKPVSKKRYDAALRKRS